MSKQPGAGEEMPPEGGEPGQKQEEGSQGARTQPDRPEVLGSRAEQVHRAAQPAPAVRPEAAETKE